MTIYAEGVVKFQVRFADAPALPVDQLAELNAWRRIMVWLELLGQTPSRYEGYGFGNISRRIEPFAASPTRRGFVITGTQTGGVIDAQPEHYVTVKECYPARNLVVAEGPVRPSSESMTHGAIYAQDSRIRWVMHGHSPHIWRNAAALSIPITDATVPYGTPEMSAEVARLFRATDVRRQRVFSMGGHDDGVVSFGRTAEEAGAALLNSLAKSLIVYRPLG
jgi:L-ribulose-5-phosphate 4-epimerase